jgi:hypothetical protein
MQTTIRALTGRPQAAWKTWLLGLLVLGIVGMHGLVLGAGTTAAHHGLPTAVPAAAAAVDDTAHHSWPMTSSTTSEAPTMSDGGGDEDSTTAIALCMALLLAFVVVLAGARRTTWVSLLDRLSPRQVLPEAPLLRARTPVPRFTVMRC